MKYLILCLFSFALFSCKPKEEAAGPMGPSEKQAAAKTLESLLTEEDIMAVYPEATNLTAQTSTGMWPSVTYRFEVGGERGTLTFTGLTEGADAAAFEFSKEALSKNKIVPASGIGEKAFYTEHPVNQLSVLSEGRILHIALRVNNQGDREKAETLMKRVLEK